MTTDQCPVCGEQGLGGCRCFRSSNQCKNGHYWHYCVSCDKTVIGELTREGHAKDINECTCDDNMQERTLMVANFANSKLLANPVCISKTSPHWWNPPDKAFEPRLAPGDFLWDYKDGKITEEDYTKLYLAQLKDLDERGYNWDLLIGKVLVCWCAKGKFCHRNILADFLEKKGFKVTRS